MRHDGQGGQYREQNVIIFTLWDGRLFSLVQAWEYSYSNNIMKEDIARSRCKSRCKSHVEMSWDLQNVHIVSLENGYWMSSTPAKEKP